jgi:hypothetical protein
MVYATHDFLFGLVPVDQIATVRPAMAFPQLIGADGDQFVDRRIFCGIDDAQLDFSPT